jgi:transcriptional/translational regulatory protein YebC/TACO1
MIMTNKTTKNTLSAEMRSPVRFRKNIKRGTGELEGVQYVEMSYEGYGPGGVALLRGSMSVIRSCGVWLHDE